MSVSRQNDDRYTRLRSISNAEWGTLRQIGFRQNIIAALHKAKGVRGRFLLWLPRYDAALLR